MGITRTDLAAIDSLIAQQQKNKKLAADQTDREARLRMAEMQVRNSNMKTKMDMEKTRYGMVKDTLQTAIQVSDHEQKRRLDKVNVRLMEGQIELNAAKLSQTRQTMVLDKVKEMENFVARGQVQSANMGKEASGYVNLANGALENAYGAYMDTSIPESPTVRNTFLDDFYGAVTQKTGGSSNNTRDRSNAFSDTLTETSRIQSTLLRVVGIETKGSKDGGSVDVQARDVVDRSARISFIGGIAKRALRSKNGYAKNTANMILDGIKTLSDKRSKENYTEADIKEIKAAEKQIQDNWQNLSPYVKANGASFQILQSPGDPTGGNSLVNNLMTSYMPNVGMSMTNYLINRDHADNIARKKRALEHKDSALLNSGLSMLSNITAIAANGGSVGDAVQVATEGNNALADKLHSGVDGGGGNASGASDTANTGQSGATQPDRAGIAGSLHTGATDTTQVSVPDSLQIGMPDTTQASVADTTRASVADTMRAGVADTMQTAQPDTMGTVQPDTTQAKSADALLSPGPGKGTTGGFDIPETLARPKDANNPETAQVNPEYRADKIPSEYNGLALHRFPGFEDSNLLQKYGVPARLARALAPILSVIKREENRVGGYAAFTKNNKVVLEGASTGGYNYPTLQEAINIERSGKASQFGPYQWTPIFMEDLKLLHVSPDTVLTPKVQDVLTAMLLIKRHKIDKHISQGGEKGILGMADGLSTLFASMPGDESGLSKYHDVGSNMAKISWNEFLSYIRMSMGAYKKGDI